MQQQVLRWATRSVQFLPALSIFTEPTQLRRDEQRSTHTPLFSFRLTPPRRTEDLHPPRRTSDDRDTPLDSLNASIPFLRSVSSFPFLFWYTFDYPLVLYVCVTVEKGGEIERKQIVRKQRDERLIFLIFSFQFTREEVESFIREEESSLLLLLKIPPYNDIHPLWLVL